MQEAVAVQQERYTIEQVERLLTRHLHRREELDLRGPMRERLFVRVPADVVPTPTVHDAVLERADLFRALNRIPTHYRRLLVLWYATDWSTDRIVAWFQTQFPKVSRRTVFRWRQQAVQVLTRQMNNNRCRVTLTGVNLATMADVSRSPVLLRRYGASPAIEQGCAFAIFARCFWRRVLGSGHPGRQGETRPVDIFARCPVRRYSSGRRVQFCRAGA